MKESERFLFVRPPRPLWPFNGAGSAFWPPLAFASLAAALREAIPDLRVGILDAPALEMGWRSLTERLRTERPAFVGIGEEAVSCREGLRVATLARAAGARVIAGGCFFGEAAAETLATGVVDAVVHNEGERTLVELVECLRSGDDLRQVAGISFLEGDSLVRTEPRALIEDLDTLPMPAYDLLPVARYGARSKNHTGLAAVESSRGCSFGCDFCVLWRQMGMTRNGKTFPHLRVKSPERLFEEARELMDRYGRRYLGWVDPCFNCSGDVPVRFAELLLRAGRRVGQSAWVRANYLVRDERGGALEPVIRAGLNEVYIGIERLDPGALKALKKGNLKGEVPEALGILEGRYPEVVAVGSFIYGLENDTLEDVRALARQSLELPLDVRLYIPRTPLPGTPGWRAALEVSGSLSEFGRSLDFLPAMNASPRRDDLTRELYKSVLRHWPWKRVLRELRTIFSPSPRKRSIARRHAFRSAKFMLGGLTGRKASAPLPDGLYTPGWYET